MEPELAKLVLWSPFFLLAGPYGCVTVLWWIARPSGSPGDPVNNVSGSHT